MMKILITSILIIVCVINIYAEDCDSIKKYDEQYQNNYLNLDTTLSLGVVTFKEIPCYYKDITFIEDLTLYGLNIDVPDDFYKIPIRALRLNNVKSEQAIKILNNLAKLNYLHALYIDSTDITQLNADIELPERLELINFKNSEINSLPNSISNIKNLTNLGFINCNIKEFNPAITTIKDLKTLIIMHGGKFDSLPNSIVTMKKLDILYLCGIKFKDPDNEFSKILKIKSITNIGFADNSLTTIPKEVSTCLNLKTLILKNNKIRIIPNYLWKLTNLESLDISNNPIQNISNEIYKMKNLVSITMDDIVYPNKMAELLTKLLPHARILLSNGELQNGLFKKNIR